MRLTSLLLVSFPYHHGLLQSYALHTSLQCQSGLIVNKANGQLAEYNLLDQKSYTACPPPPLALSPSR